MLTVITRFLGLNVINYHPAIPWGIGAVYVALLFASFLSVRSLNISTWVKFFWLFIILALPVAGIAIYTLRCVFRADWTFIKPLLVTQSPTGKSVIHGRKSS